MIQRGAPIRKDVTLKKFVHASCAKVTQAVVRQEKKKSASSSAAAAEPALPHGLTQTTLEDYEAEWNRYVQFASARRDIVPGRDVPWELPLVWQYMQFRGRTCKPETIKQVLTKLAHFGARNKFILATNKFDGDAVSNRAIAKMKQQQVIDARAEAHDTSEVFEAVERSTPVGHRGVSTMLSAFRITNEERFNELNREDRHHIVASVMQHTGGMRFGHFRDRHYTVESFNTDARDGSLRLITDWARYSGRRMFSIEFSANPRFECMWYHLYAPSGDLIDTYPAATVLHWHIARLRRDGETRIFAPIPSTDVSRDDRQRWLQDVFSSALPIVEVQARALIPRITPHSFRPGLAGDLYREGVALQRVASICRWNTRRVVRLYAERPSMSMFRLTNGFRLIERF